MSGKRAKIIRNGNDRNHKRITELQKALKQALAIIQVQEDELTRLRPFSALAEPTGELTPTLDATR